MQVRYADTPAQKDLKRVTTERRQFRTNEYNVGAYGASPEMITLSPPMPSPRIVHMHRQIPQSRASGGSWKREASDSLNGWVDVSLFLVSVTNDKPVLSPIRLVLFSRKLESSL